MALLLLPSKIYSLLSLATLVLILYVTPTTGDDSPYQICGTTGNYTANSTYQSNLKILLPSLSSKGSLTGFNTTDVGQTPDQVYGQVLCRGDTNATLCRSCLDTAGQGILQLCPSNKEATIWYDRCLLRYSNQRFIPSDDDNSLQVIMWNAEKVTDPSQFSGPVMELIDRISNWAAYNSSLRFATGEVDLLGEFPKIYGLAQCTADLPVDGCRQCLDFRVPIQFAGRRGARVLGVRCSLRYEVYSFYDGASTLVLSSPPAPSPPLDVLPSGETGKENTARTAVLLIIIPIIGVLVLLSGLIYACYKRRETFKRKNNGQDGVIDQDELTSRTVLFDLSTLRDATDNFSDANKLGQGGFGPVYVGVLSDGQQIAVKRLSRCSKQGIVELINEVKLLAKLQHKNLVNLLGFCLGEQEKLLVYEFLPNGSLDRFLLVYEAIELIPRHNLVKGNHRSKQREQLDWRTRYKIIEGIGRGLLYLHEDSRLKIIHRDLKPSNILLDGHMNPKISDFGLARLFGGESQGITSRLAGTYGYMPPEYIEHKQFSTGSDVYSYGVLVLEIVTGQKNRDFDAPDHGAGLLSHVWQHWNEDKVLNLVDQSVSNDYQLHEVVRVVHIGLLCVQADPAMRPSMAAVVLMLSTHLITAPSPTVPGFCQPEAEGYLNSVNHISMTEMQPR